MGNGTIDVQDYGKVTSLGKLDVLRAKATKR